MSQSTFTTALLDPGQQTPEGLLDGQGLPAGKRFNVYRNNVAVSLTEALHSAFPVIARLLGKENMDGLAGMYLRAHPPSSPLMMFYGASFPAFLAGMAQLSHLGYLPDVARLELAMRHAYHAADADPIDPDLLARTDPEALMQATVTLAPAVRLLRSDWPVFDIWRFNTEPDAPKPAAIAQDVLITRPDFDPVPQPLSPGGADWIAALQRGEPIGAAHDAALAATPDFDLAASLALLLQGGTITSLNVKG
ncbi:DNA-binding domain-containing protein [Seohaeicola saemankumensis]|nr:DNA-binding domain-containing protein [Seohaeicola saemankumensis]MCA0869999.1 DNA-binding domain-containing protein [Seohaeicola saemankumensis]